MQKIQACESNLSKHKNIELPSKQVINEAKIADTKPVLFGGSEQLMAENDWLKKKIQKVDKRHEYMGQELLKRLNEVERRMDMIGAKETTSDHWKAKLDEKVQELELFVNYM